MKYKYLLLVLVSFLVCGCGKSTDNSENDIAGKVAVAEFFISDGFQSKVIDVSHLKVLISNELSNRSNWMVLESSELGLLEKEQLFSASKADKSVLPTNLSQQSVTTLVDEETGISGIKIERFDINWPPVSKLPDLPSADFLLLGAISGLNLDVVKVVATRGVHADERGGVGVYEPSLRAQALISIRIVNAKTREITHTSQLLFDHIISFSQNDQAMQASLLKEISNQVISKFLLSVSGDIRVAAVQVAKASLVLNRGRDNGVTEGMTFSVNRILDDIRDPETNKRIGFNSELIGHSIVSSVDRATSIASVEALNGKTVLQGDILIPDGVNGKDQSLYLKSNRVFVGGLELPDQGLLGWEQEFEIAFKKTLDIALVKAQGIDVVDVEGGDLRAEINSRITEQNSSGLRTLISRARSQSDTYLFIELDSLDYEAAPKQTRELFGRKEIIRESIKYSVGGVLHVVHGATGEYVLSERVELTNSKGSNSLGAELAQLALVKLIEKIQPLSVIYISEDNELFLNYGTPVVEAGDQFDIYIDRDLGSKLTATPKKNIGRIQVSGFSPEGWAISNIVTGTAVIGASLNKVVPDSSSKSLKQEAQRETYRNW